MFVIDLLIQLAVFTGKAGDLIELYCPTNQVINVHFARYIKNRCGDMLAFDKVKDICQQKAACSFTVDDIFFNDTSCPTNIKERFQIGYDCINGTTIIIDDNVIIEI